jgi:tetratricopeptide (TPR) repeat protein
VLRARIMIERGELESARASLLRAEEIDAEVVEAHYYLGIVHERFSQPEEALRRYRLAAKLDPTSAQYVVASAEMLIHLKRLDEADAILSSPHEALTHNAAIRQTSGHVALLRGQTERAVELFGQARLLAPDDASVLEDLVRAQMAARNYGDAEVNIGTLLRGKDNESRRDLLLWRAECLAATNRMIEARSVLDRLTSDREGQADIQAWLALGRVAAALKDEHRLRICAARTIALAPDRPDGYLMRAIHLRSTGELPGALIAIDTAIRLDQDATTPRLLRALILQEMGMTDDAAKSLTHVLERHPNHALAGRMMAMVQSTAVYAAAPR